MIRKKIGVDIVRSHLKGNHFFVDQILNLVFEVDLILSIMSNVVGVIHISLIGSVEFVTRIHRLGPHQVNVSSRKQSLVQIYSAFSKRGNVFGGFFSNIGRGGS